MQNTVSMLLFQQENWAWSWFSPHFLYLDADVFAYSMPKEFCLWQRSDCPPGVEGKLWLQNELKPSWRPRHVFKYEMPDSQLGSVWWRLLQQELSTSERSEFHFPLVKHFILWGLSIFTSTHCKAAGPKCSAGRTTLHLLPFCLKDLLRVALRYLDILEESWVDFSQVMPKGIISKQAGLSLFYNMGKTFPSILHTT